MRPLTSYETFHGKFYKNDGVDAELNTIRLLILVCQWSRGHRFDSEVECYASNASKGSWVARNLNM